MRLALAAALLALPATVLAQEAAEPPTPSSVVAAAPASDWKPIDPADLLVMDLAPDAAGKPRRVIVQLVPKPFSQGWVENIRAMAKAHWWDGTSVYRVVDNWVAQWGDVDETKPLPEGLRVVPESEYVTAGLFVPEVAAQVDLAWQDLAFVFLQNALAASNQQLLPPAGFEEAMESGNIDALPEPEMPKFPDPFADISSHVLGWPIASVMNEDGLSTFWPIHCYGSVGVARDTETTGTGAELYAVIGHAPRQLDRNIAVVGRVIEGIEHLSTLPRGPAATNGVYEDPALRVPIVSVRLGNEVTEFPQPRFEYLASESESFAEYVRVRANRQDSFYKVPAGGIDVCNVQVPIRRVPSE